jgi:hypothetical protein
MNRLDFPRTIGTVPPLEPRFQQILEEREAEHRRVLVEHDHRYGQVVYAFSGPASFGLITRTAAQLEAEGKTVHPRWRRGSDGLISGVDIVELAPVNGR